MIVILRALGLGDLLTAMPALRAVRRARPAQQLAIAAPIALAPLIHQSRVVDRIIGVPSAVTAPPGSLRWREPPPDLAVNLHGKGPQSTDVLRELDPAELWAYGTSGAPPWHPADHEVRRWCRLVEAYGCRTRPADLYLATPGSGDGPVVIHPGAAGANRRWPTRRFAAVARNIAERRFGVVVTAGPGERELAVAVARQAGLAMSSVVSDIDLAQLTDLVRESRLVICGDTGIAHLATAYRTRSVVLFGPQAPQRWGPPESPLHRVIWRPEPADRVASDQQPHPALHRIEAADVLAAVDDLLSQRRLARA